MIRPSQPKPKRDELAKQISFLNPSLMRRGAEALKEFRRIEKLPGSTRQDAYEGSAKFAGPEETGIFREAAGNEVFELNDRKGFEIMPGLQSYFGKRGGYTPRMPAGLTMRHDELFDRMPELKNVGTRFVMPAEGADIKGGATYWDKSKGGEGDTLMTSAATERDPNSPDAFGLRGLASHEIGEHAVADYSGRPMGDSQDNMDMAAAFGRLVHPRVVKYRDELEKFKQGLGISEEDWVREYADADQTLKAASRLYKPARGSKGKRSALPYYERYRDVAGEAQGRKVDLRKDMTTEERMLNPPWLPAEGEAPYWLQMINENDNYRMPDDRNVLRDLMERRKR